MQKKLRFYISNDINSLAEHWIHSTHINKDVFKPHFILTQTQGMNNWLKLKRVQLTGNSTHIAFTTPNDFLLKIYEVLHVNNTVKISNKNIDWLIYKTLSSEEFKSTYPYIASYYKNEDNTFNEVKQWELAYNTADLFDQYQIYRQDILRQWMLDDRADDKFGWQQYIWRALHNLLGERLIDLSQIQHNVLELLQQVDVQEKIQKHFDHISLFGISILSPYHIQMLYALSECIQIDFYLLNPSPDVYWELDKSEKYIIKSGRKEHFNIGHELLTNWGKVIQTTFKLLNQDDTLLNTAEILDIQQVDNSTLLNALKNTIYNNDIEFQDWQMELIQDKSIEINSHYSIQNEVVGLLNYIIDLTQKKPHIKDSDILILCTNINQYAPYIRSIFSNNDFGIRYTISDESLDNQDSIITTLIDILQFNYNEFKIEDVFQLLEHQSIKSKFGLEQIDEIKRIIVNLNIKYGIHNHTHDDTYLVSWLHGVKKLWLSIAMCDQDHVFIDGLEIAIKDIIDDNNLILQLNQFFEFIQQLIYIQYKIQNELNLSEWKTVVDDIIQHTIYTEDDNYIEEYEHIIQQLNQIETIDEIIEFEKIPFSVFSHRLSVVLQHLKDENKFLKRGITFCSPIPFRSVPFKVIGFLGLNAQDFPRMHKDSTVNYISQHPRLGDRNLKDNDKHLFLESLLAAEEKFYLSYIGVDSKENVPLSPSIVVEELLDYIQSQVHMDINVRALLVTQYPLNNYSYKYNNPQFHLNNNYLIRPDKGTLAIFKNSDGEKASMTEIAWQDVIKFFCNPAQYYFNVYRKIYFDTQHLTIENIEKTTIEKGAESTQLKNKILRQVIYEHKDINKLLHHQYLDGALPLKNLGLKYIHQFQSEIESLYQRIDNAINGAQWQSHTVQLQHEEITFTHQVRHFNHTLIEFTSSTNSFKYMLVQFLNALILEHNNFQGEYHIIDSSNHWQLRQLSHEERKNWILTLINFYLKYKNHPLPIDDRYKIKTNWDEDKSLKSILKAQYSSSYNTYLLYILENYNIEAYRPVLKMLAEDIYNPIAQTFEKK